MSYFLPNILAKKKIYKFRVKKILADVFGGQNAQKCSKMQFFAFCPPKNTPNFF